VFLLDCGLGVDVFWWSM